MNRRSFITLLGGRIMAGDGAKQPRAIAGCPRKRPNVVRGEAKRHGAVARHARLRALDAGYAAHGRRQPDGAAGVRPERPIDEAGGDRRARPRRGAARAPGNGSVSATSNTNITGPLGCRITSGRAPALMRRS
jgi:hypothetical protein